MPREGDIPLTQDGYEDMDAYFKSPEARAASARKSSSKKQIARQSSPDGYYQSQQQPSSASRRIRPNHKPDVAHELGYRGR